MQHRTMARMLSLAMLGATLVLGCQLPQQPKLGQPRVMVNLGTLKFEKDADLALVLRFQKGDFSAQSLASTGVQRVQVSVTSPDLATPIAKEITQAEFQSGLAVFNFSNIPPGQVSVRVNAFDAAGTLIQWATGETTITPGQTAVLNLYCNIATGNLKIVYDCPDCPTPEPSTIPTPTPTPAGTAEATASTNTPWGIAVDGLGNVWVTDKKATVSKFLPNGELIATYSTGLTPYYVDIDSDNNAWVTGHGNQSIHKIDQSGAVTSYWGVYDHPSNVKIDKLGYIWVGYDSVPPRLVKWTSASGSIASAGAFEPEGNPTGLAFDNSNNVWVASYTGNKVIALDKTSGWPGTRTADIPVGSTPMSVAVDTQGNIWTANRGSDTVSRIKHDKSHTDTISVGDGPWNLSIAPDGTVWVANFDGDSITKIASNGVVIETLPASGPAQIAFDNAGYAWVTNYRDGTVRKIKR